MATWLIHDGVKNGTWTLPNGVLNKLLQSLDIPQRRSRQTGIVPPPVQDVKAWEMRWLIGRTSIETTASNKIIAASNHGILPCVASEAVYRQPASAVRLMNDVSISVHAFPQGK